MLCARPIMRPHVAAALNPTLAIPTALAVGPNVSTALSVPPRWPASSSIAAIPALALVDPIRSALWQIICPAASARADTWEIPSRAADVHRLDPSLCVNPIPVDRIVFAALWKDIPHAAAKLATLELHPAVDPSAWSARNVLRTWLVSTRSVSILALALVASMPSAR